MLNLRPLWVSVHYKRQPAFYFLRIYNCNCPLRFFASFSATNLTLVGRSVVRNELDSIELMSVLIMAICQKKTKKNKEQNEAYHIRSKKSPTEQKNVRPIDSLMRTCQKGEKKKKKRDRLLYISLAALLHRGDVGLMCIQESVGVP